MKNVQTETTDAEAVRCAHALSLAILLARPAEVEPPARHDAEEAAR